MSQGCLPDYTHSPLTTDKHVAGGIRTHNSSNQAATHPRLRPRHAATGIAQYRISLQLISLTMWDYKVTPTHKLEANMKAIS